MKSKSLITIYCLPFTVYFFIAIFFTYPLVRNISCGIYGYPGDSLSSIHSFWWKKEALLTGKTLSFFPNFNYPFGIVEPLFKEVLASGPAEILAVFTNEVFAYNFFVFFSFPLAGFAMFLLIRYLTKNSFAAFISGLVYAFSPYHLWQSYSHFSLSQIQWLPLFVLALVKLDKKISSANILFLAITFFITFWSGFYYGYFALLFVLAWLVVRKNYLTLARFKTFGFAALCTVIFSIPILLPALLQKLNDPYHLRSSLYQYKQLNISDFAAFTARPWDYFLPATDHFLFGNVVNKIYFNIRQFGENSQGLNYIFKDAGRAEATLYLGIIPLFLAIFAISCRTAAKRKPVGFLFLTRWVREPASTAGRLTADHTSIFAILTIIFFLTSLLPYAGISRFKIIFPSYFLVQVFPMFRVLARMGVIVMLCVSVLAGIGTSKILAKLAAPTEKLVITCLVAVLILVEFFNVPPWHFTNLDFQPEVYKWISQKSGDFAIAEYPRGYDTNFSAFFQRIHGKKVLSADLIGNDDLLNPNLDKKLKVYQVKYVLFHKKLPFKNKNPTNPAQSQYLQEKPTVASENIVLAKSFEDTEVYEVR